MRVYHAVVGATALALALSFSGATFAQSGTTSGMAPAHHVKSSESMHKGTNKGRGNKINKTDAATAGVAGKKGSKSGPAATAPK